jgi:hypothetical protein
MFTIKTFNNISGIVFLDLPSPQYNVSAEAENYQGALVRSANLHGHVVFQRASSPSRAPEPA